MKHTTLAALLAVGVLAGALASPLTVRAESNFQEDVPTGLAEDTAATSRVSLAVGERVDLSRSLTWGVFDEEANDPWYLVGTAHWVSHDPEIAAVDSGGVVTGWRVGTTTVTATWLDNRGRTHIHSFTVGVSSKAATASGNSFTITDGKWLNLGELISPGSSGKISFWSSSNSAIASVDESGLMLAESIGSCFITAIHTAADGTVTEQRFSIRVASLELDHHTRASGVVLSAGQSVDLSELYYPRYGRTAGTLGDVSVRTSDSARVSLDGFVLTAETAGTCTVTILETRDHEEHAVHTISVTVAS